MRPRVTSICCDGSLSWRPGYETKAQADSRSGAKLQTTGASAAFLVGTTAALLAGTRAPLSAQELVPQTERSPGKATVLSVVGTALPVAVSLRDNDAASYAFMATGLVLGPALGYVYGGDAGRGLANAGIRAAVLAATIGPALLLRDSDGDDSALQVALALGGGLATTALAVLDILHVDDRVHARNETLRVGYVPGSRAIGLIFTLIR